MADATVRQSNLHRVSEREMKTERLEPPTAPQAAVRIGFLFPVGEPTTAEYYELAERLDEPAELFVARTGGLDRHDEAGMVETGRVERLRIRLNALRAHAPHVIAFPCTCARFGYPAGADTQAAELARAAGVPATSATVGLGAACRAVGHSRP
jgi:hypothetical protein